MNRDYDKRPTQGHGRSQQDYGNTHLDENRHPPMTGVLLCLPIGAALWAVILLIWWLA